MNDSKKKPSNLVQHFKWDVFLSHVTSNNKINELVEEKLGLISYIKKLMTLYVGGHLSHDLRAFLSSDNLPGSTSLEQILPEVKRSAIFLVFLSDAYVDLNRESEWCQKEAIEFYNHAISQPIGIHIENRWRVFKILLDDVALEKQHPPYFRIIIQQPHFHLFKYDNNNKKVPLRPEFREETRRELFEKVGTIALEIVDMLKLLDSKLTAQQAKQQATQQTNENSQQSNLIVYLADTTSDLGNQYHSLKHELREKGYTLLPESPLPTQINQVEKEVRAYLERASLSIHLVGEKYGLVPEGTECSLPVLQNQLAATHSQSHPEFLRIVWMSPNLHSEDFRQEQFIQSLQDLSSETDIKLDLNRNLFEEFKFFIYKKLEELKNLEQGGANSQPAVVTESTTKRVYLLYDKLDKDQVVQLKSYLYTFDNLEVLEPVVDESEASTDLTKLREQHESNLKLCDAVLIYWGYSRKNWLQAKQREVIKSTNARSIPLPKAIYLGEPLSQEEKFKYQSWGFDIIQELDDALDQFLAQIIREQSLPPC